MKKKLSIRLLKYVYFIFVYIFMTCSVFASSSLEQAISQDAIPLVTTNPTSPLSDLTPLKALLKDKTLVGVGEATHHTKEFFDMKHRLFKFLVEELNFKAFAIELDFASTTAINNYVLYGDSTAKDALLSTEFWVWKTEEMVEFIDWIKTYNLDKPLVEKVRFYGFDIQNTKANIELIYNYIAKVDPQTALTLKETVATTSTSEDTTALTSLTKQLQTIIVTHKASYIAASTPSEYDFISHGITNLYQSIANKSSSTVYGAISARDLAMAKNIEWLVAFEKQTFNNEKMMLWAHNGHIAETFTYPVMGSHLAKTFKDNYYSIGFDFYKGSFMAYNNFTNKKTPTQFMLSNSPTGHLSTRLEPLKDDIIFIDMKKASTNPVLSAITSVPQNIYVFGAATSPFYQLSDVIKLTPSKTFDGMIYIENTTTPTNLVFSSENIVKTKLR